MKYLNELIVEFFFLAIVPMAATFGVFFAIASIRRKIIQRKAHRLLNQLKDWENSYVKDPTAAKTELVRLHRALRAMCLCYTRSLELVNIDDQHLFDVSSRASRLLVEQYRLIISNGRDDPHPYFHELHELKASLGEAVDIRHDEWDDWWRVNLKRRTEHLATTIDVQLRPDGLLAPEHKGLIEENLPGLLEKFEEFAERIRVFQQEISQIEKTPIAKEG